MPQTGPITTEHLEIENQQILSFDDASPSGSILFPPLSDPTYGVGAMRDGTLSEFFERPVKIHEVTWTEGSPLVAADIAPWYLYFNQVAIKKKLDNYALLQCNLHVKVVLNASPFYYGALLVSYQPLPQYSNAIATSTPSLENCAYTQRPHIIAFPANNQGGEMLLPFISSTNWIRTYVGNDFTNMGTLTIREIIGLTNANGVSSASVNVQFYAWATNVKLSTPTAELAVQSGKKTKKDEYGQGPVSKVASAVANVASKLKSVPVLAPFAMATEIGANAVSGIASIFGYTNVPVISDIMPVSISCGHGVPSSGIGVPATKLTLDPKNELSIDPRTVGLSGGDELAISNIVGRESLLFTIDWSTSDASNLLLAALPIAPFTMYTRANGVSQDLVQLTPMALVANMFEYWHGDIIVRIRAVCSQYHKGRLKISWDPIKNIVTDNADYSNTSFTKIVDLTPDMDYEIRIPFSQAQHWLRTYNIQTSAGYNWWRKKGDVLAFYNTDGEMNGNLTIRVLNVLTAPVATSDAHLMVFVRGAENLEFTNPTPHFSNHRMSYFSVQSGNMESTTGSDGTNESYRIYSGEAVGSLRVLLRRSIHVSPIVWNTFTIDPALHTGAVLQANFSQFPPQPGFQPGAPTTLSQIVGVGSAPGTSTAFNPFTLLAPCFIGMRGSMIWHLAPDQADWRKYFTTIVTRGDRVMPVTGSPSQVVETALVTTGTTSQGVLKEFYDDNIPNGESGMVPFGSAVQPIESVSAPFYRCVRMMPTKLSYGYTLADARVSTANSNRWNDDGYIKVTIPLKPAVVDEVKLYSMQRWFSIGTDFSMFGFLNVPLMYRYSITPSTV